MGSLSINGRSIEYYEWGNSCNKRVVLCIHGLTRNAHDFDYIAKSLSDKYRVVAIDLAGHGLSSNMPHYSQYHYTRFLSDVMAVLAHLAIDSVIWIGSSLGGIIALYAWESNPKLINKLILNDIGPQASPFSFSSLQNVDVDSMRKHFIFNNYEDYKKRFISMFPILPFPTIEHLQHALIYGAHVGSDGRYYMNFDAGVFSLFVNTHNIMRREGLWHIWSTVNIPILVMWGALSNFLTADIVMRMRASNNHMTLCKCMRDGHVCNLIESKQIEFIRRWIDSERDIEDAYLW